MRNPVPLSLKRIFRDSLGKERSSFQSLISEKPEGFKFGIGLYLWGPQAEQQRGWREKKEYGKR
jgi:hypothetical protein